MTLADFDATPRPSQAPRTPDAGPPAPGDAAPAEGTPWHARASRDVLDLWQTQMEGLPEGAAAQRRKQFGPNVLPHAPEKSLLQRLAQQFNNRLIWVLLVASVVTALLGHWIDTGVILGVVLINAAIGFWQEGKAENALSAVRQMLSADATIMRHGQRHTVPAEELVPGDIVIVEPGDRVPADLRLVEAKGLRIDESALTGESVPSEKSTTPVAEDVPLAERTSMAYSGTLVTAGRATGVVVATGQVAEIGRIGALLKGVEETTTPLLQQINSFSKWLTLIVLIMCVAVLAFALLLRGYAIDDAFLAVIGMAVAAIPEGLPAVITITLALGVQRMAQRQAIIRRLPAVETLGAVSVICTDKTGTLTLNEMAVRSVKTAIDGPEIQVTGDGYRPQGALVAPLDDPAVEVRDLVVTAVLCSDAQLIERDGLWTVSGDPMDGALVSLAHKAGIDPAKLRETVQIIDDIPFDSGNRFNAVLVSGDGTGRIHVKGAPQRIIDMCDRAHGRHGSARLDREAWADAVEKLAARGQRVLAFAVKDVAGCGALDMGMMESGFTLLGIAGFADPARPEAIEAIRDCHQAGIDVKMITGDHAATALAIARDLGLRTEHGALTGREVEAMTADRLRDRAADVDVFARATPENKLQLIEAFQSERKVVSMTGDGVNDAPALKKADVGVAMGIKGTEAAKSASRVVIADDNFASIAAAVREGRVVYDNIRKVIAWTLPTNCGESLIVIAAILLGLTLPLQPTHILWINMITAVALGLTLAFEPPEPAVMRRPPRKMNAAILDGEMMWRIVLVSVLMAGAAFGAFLWSKGQGQSAEYARTLAVNVIVAMEIFYLFSVRAQGGRRLSLETFFGSRAVLIGVGLTILLQLLFTYAPPLQFVFDTEALSLGDLAMALLFGLALFVFLEVEKALRRRIAGPPPGGSAITGTR